MIIDLPDTTTNAINARLVRLRDEGGAVALGRVLTLVIDAGTGDPETAIEAANDASREHPCRIIVIQAMPRRRKARLDGQIRVGGDAGASEVVILRTSGVSGDAKDTLVNALLLPDAPIVVWWVNHVPESPIDDPLGAMAGRRITDAMDCCDGPSAFVRLAANYTAGDTDLAWARITNWRGVLAATLDTPPHDKVTAIHVEGPTNRPGVGLLAAWLAQFLKAPATVQRSSGVDGVSLVRLERKSGAVVLSRPDGRTLTIESPGQPTRRILMPKRSLAEVLSEELRRLDPDDIYGEVLTKGLAKVQEV